MKTIIVAASILAFGVLAVHAQDKKEEIISPQPGTAPHQCWDLSTSTIRDKDALSSTTGSTAGNTSGSAKGVNSNLDARSGSPQSSTVAPPVAKRSRPSGMPAC